MTKAKLVNQILDLSKGSFMSVTFIKKNGAVRIMNCRTQVSKGSKNIQTNRAERDAELGQRTVYDMVAKNYRKINLDRVLCIKMKGNTIWI